jgi:hypothetical protein
MLAIRGRQECAEVVVEPPRDARGSRIFEIDDGVFVAGEVSFIEESAGAVHQAERLINGVCGNALAMEPREERGGACPVETFVVIENANSHSVALLPDAVSLSGGMLRMLARGRSVKRARGCW